VAGYGEAAIGPLSIQVMDMGLAFGLNAPPIAYPYPNQQNVPASFLGNELPDPLPAGVTQPVGYPITLELGSADVLTVTRSRLLDATGAEVPSSILNPGANSLDSTEWALLAKAPLQPGETYKVEVVGQLNGAPFSKTWSFRVAGTGGTLQ
jgi:hypothetical protein